jgi:hypothetical protein
MFEVVTDLAEIAHLNEKLASRLRKTFRYHEVREITYPSGHFPSDVFFEKKKGKQVYAWTSQEWTDKWINFILIGDPGSSKWLEITVQLNFPAEKYTRLVAGAFVKDAGGEVFVAHRGKLTKGNAGLLKKEVLDRFSTCVEAKDIKGLEQLILIASLDAPDLADQLCKFAVDARRVATELGAQKALQAQMEKESIKGTVLGTQQGATESESDVQSRLLKLSAYYDEFSGESWTLPSLGGARVVEHGSIVKALEAQVRDRGETRKSQAIDLAVLGPKNIDIFEVKTSAKTTDVYTGVGQLFIHGESISKLLKVPVRRHLVLPERPSETLEPYIVGKGGINIITFDKINDNYCFNGI